jgi:hypothetical protein
MWTGRFQSRANWSHDTVFMLDLVLLINMDSGWPTAVPPGIVEASVGKVGQLGQDIQDSLPNEVPSKLLQSVSFHSLIYSCN